MLPKTPHILICADILTPSHIEAIAAAVEGWATWEHIPQDASPDEFGPALARTDIVVGWAPANLLVKSPVQLYLCGSAGYDAYEGHGLHRKPGFVHCSARGTMSIAIAEHALAMMLLFTRRLPEHMRHQAQGQSHSYL